MLLSKLDLDFLVECFRKRDPDLKRGRKRISKKVKKNWNRDTFRVADSLSLTYFHFVFLERGTYERSEKKPANLFVIMQPVLFYPEPTQVNRTGSSFLAQLFPFFYIPAILFYAPPACCNTSLFLFEFNLLSCVNFNYFHAFYSI